jgi:uncharacterized protein (TIGR00369 family)
MNLNASEPKLDLAGIEAFLRREFPELYAQGDLFSVLEIGAGTSRVRLNYHPTHLRPGGTMSGPAMMQLADVAIWVALLGAIGEVALAVTTNFSINFLRKPEPKALIADCSFLKIGRTLATGEAKLFSEGGSKPVAHAVATYAIPKLR